MSVYVSCSPKDTDLLCVGFFFLVFPLLILFKISKIKLLVKELSALKWHLHVSRNYVPAHRDYEQLTNTVGDSEIGKNSKAMLIKAVFQS